VCGVIRARDPAEFFAAFKAKLDEGGLFLEITATAIETAPETVPDVDSRPGRFPARVRDEPSSLSASPSQPSGHFKGEL
jgi:hypothetical protein